MFGLWKHRPMTAHVVTHDIEVAALRSRAEGMADPRFAKRAAESLAHHAFDLARSA